MRRLALPHGRSTSSSRSAIPLGRRSSRTRWEPPLRHGLRRPLGLLLLGSLPPLPLPLLRMISKHSPFHGYALHFHSYHSSTCTLNLTSQISLFSKMFQSRLSPRLGWISCSLGNSLTSLYEEDKGTISAQRASRENKMQEIKKKNRNPRQINL